MSFMQLTLLYCLLSFFAGDQAFEYSSSSKTKIVELVKEAEATNIILQSKDGGQTWQDISHGLPEMEQPEGFFAGASEVYLRTNGVMYRSKSNLKTPVWEKENELDPQFASIAFNRSGVMAYDYGRGKIHQKMPGTGSWLPVYTNFEKQPGRPITIFETADGSVLVGCDNGIYKSTDRGQSWKHVFYEHWAHVKDLVEAEGVLLAAGQKGIMRSTDNGEHWEWVLSEGGGVGMDIERIDGGFAAIAYNTRTKSRRIFFSSDSGKTWKTLDKGLKPSPLISSVKQMGSDLFVGHPDGIFRSSDMGKTWQRVHAGFGNEPHPLKFVSLNPAPVKKVFKLYVSASVLYAVAVTPGC